MKSKKLLIIKDYKSTGTLNRIIRLKHATGKVTKFLYKAVAMSVITYGSESWIPTKTSGLVS